MIDKDGIKKVINSAFQTLFAYLSAVLFKLEEKRDVTGHAQKVDDIHTGSRLPHKELQGRLAKI